MTEIAVVMATRNSAAYLAEALDSITGQGRHGLDIAVVDAASTDGTQDIVAGVPDARLIPQTGTGLWQAWNQAIAATSAPLIAMLDSDDRWQPGALATHLRALEQHPAALVSIGRVRFFLQGDTVPSGVRPELLHGDHRGTVPGACLYRREVFDRMGPWPEDLPTAGDIAWFARLRRSGLPITQPDAVVLAKRVHPDNLGGQFERDGQYDRDLIRIARESLQRRAAAAPGGTGA